MTYGDPILRTGNPLSVELGPGKYLDLDIVLDFILFFVFINWIAGILETIFDGIQRPLKDIAERAENVFIPRGIELPCLDQNKLWDFKPNRDLKVGDLITGGDIVGNVYENTLFKDHKIMADPKANGRIVEVYDEGQYTVSQPVCVIETVDGKQKEITMSHFWPVRSPRPVVEKLQASEPLLTGQRVLDALYPSVLGGTCAIPGAFGCGKTCIS